MNHGDNVKFCTLGARGKIGYDSYGKCLCKVNRQFLRTKSLWRLYPLSSKMYTGSNLNLTPHGTLRGSCLSSRRPASSTRALASWVLWNMWVVFFNRFCDQMRLVVLTRWCSFLLENGRNRYVKLPSDVGSEMTNISPVTKFGGYDIGSFSVDSVIFWQPCGIHQSMFRAKWISEIPPCSTRELENDRNSHADF